MFLILIHTAKGDQGDHKLMISLLTNATQFWGGIPCVITSDRALAIAAISSGKEVIMFIVSYFKILSLVRGPVQQYPLFTL